MKKFALAVAFAFAAIPVFGIALTAFADSPGQLASGPDLYQVRNVTRNGSYASTASATCNEVVKYSIKLANSEYGQLENVTIRASLANGTMTASATNAAKQQTSVSGKVTVNVAQGSLVYVAGSTKNLDVNGNLIKTLPDGITANGVNKGSLKGSTREFVQFEAKVECKTPPSKQSLLCKDLSLTVVNKEKREVSARVTGQALNGATITGYRINFGDGTVVNQQSANHTYAKDGSYTVNGYVIGTVDGKTVTVSGPDCAKPIEFTSKPKPKQALLCKDLSLTLVNKEKREVKATVTGQALNGATITGYRINFGDGTVVNQQSANHTYAQEGNYTVNGYVTGTVDGKTVIVSGENCAKAINFKDKNPEPKPVPPTPPTEEEVVEEVVLGKAIPDTGAAGLVGLTALSSGLAAAGHQLYIRRRK